MSVREMLRIRREERVPALLLLAVTIAFNVMFVLRLMPIMLHVTNRGMLMSRLLANFRLSGYDPFTLTMLSIWNVDYNPYRHPLYAFFIWPFNRLNFWLRHLLGIDCSLFIAAVLLTVVALYGMVYLRRIFTDVLDVGQKDANLLTAFFYSMAYTMLMLCVPEHFPFSMFLLILVAYLSGMCIKRGRELTAWQTVVLFVVTAGITLSNGVKVFLAALFTKGIRRFLKTAYLLLAVLLPTLLIGIAAHYEYKKMVQPRELVQQRLRGIKPQTASFDKWIDMETPRMEVAAANLFGESIQLHQDHTFEDGSGTRPLIVPYRWAINYLVEIIVVGLFVVGIWYGRRNRFLLLLLSWMAFDMLIHLGLGFGIKEIYMMSPHWLFVIPIATAFVFLRVASRWLRLGFLAVSVFLFVYNGYLLANYLL